MCKAQPVQATTLANGAQRKSSHLVSVKKDATGVRLFNFSMMLRKLGTLSHPSFLSNTPKRSKEGVSSYGRGV